MDVIFKERLKQAKLITTNDLSTVEQGAIKNEEKTEKLQTSDLSYFLNKNFFGNYDFKNVFVYQPTFSAC